MKKSGVGGRLPQAFTFEFGPEIGEGMRQVV